MYTAAPFALPCSNGIGFDLQCQKDQKGIDRINGSLLI